MARIHMIVRENPSVDVIIVIKVGPRMVLSWTGKDHGRHHAWEWEASLVTRRHMIMRANVSVDAIKVGPWMIFAWTGLDHGHHHACKWEGGNSPTAATSPMLGLELTATYLPDSKNREPRKF